MTDETIDVAPRRRPVQARSRERVDTILRLAVTLPDKQARQLVEELKCMASAYVRELIR